MKNLMLCLFAIFVLNSCNEDSKISDFEDIATTDKIKNFQLISLKEETDKLEATYAANNFNYLVKVEKSNGILNSSITISSKDNLNPITLNYILDKTIVQWELDQEQNVLKISKSIEEKFNFGKPDLKIHILALDSFLNVAPNSIQNREKLSQMAYHYSILNVIYRENSENSGCNVYPFFLTGKSLFRCQEDVFYSKNVIEKSLTTNILTNASRKREIEKVFNNTEGDVIAFKNLYNATNGNQNQKNILARQKLNRFMTNTVYESQKSIKYTGSMTIDRDNSGVFSFTKECGCASGPCGSDLGCCGNYSGCCLVWDEFCLWHDIECWNCDKWHCGICTPEVPSVSAGRDLET